VSRVAASPASFSPQLTYGLRRNSSNHQHPLQKEPQQ